MTPPRIGLRLGLLLALLTLILLRTQRPAVVRAAASDLDPSFGTSGRVVTNFSTSNVSQLTSTTVAIQSDGKTVVGGSVAISVNGNPQYSYALTRYNSDGSLDTGFGGGTGKVTTRLVADDPQPEYLRKLLIQADGKILAIGRANGLGVARYLANGTLDSTFGTGGTFVSSLMFDGPDAVLSPSGSVFISGTAPTFVNGGTDVAVAKLTSSGAFDTSFGTNGIATTKASDGNEGDSAWGLVVQPSGDIVVASYFTPVNSNAFSALVRYLPSGVPDQTFGTAGVLHLPSLNSFFAGNGIVLQPDNKILLLTILTNGVNGQLSRLNADGTFDTTFNGTGSVTTNFYWNALLQGDGKILTVGLPAGAERYTASGSLDVSFGSPVFNGDRYSDAVVQADGKIVMAGTTPDGGGYDFLVVRYMGDYGLLRQPAKLAFTPTGEPPATAGVPFATPIQVTVEDATGAPVTTDNTTQVTLAVVAGTAKLDCNGGLTAPVQAGVATFSGCALDRFGTYTIRATAGTLTPAMSNPVSVAPTSCPTPADATGLWNLDSIHAEGAWALFANCAPPGARVAIVDTGVDVNQPDLAGRIHGVHNYIDNADNIDTVGHGTHIAGIIAADRANNHGIVGISANSSLDIYKVTNSPNSFREQLRSPKEFLGAQHLAKAIMAATDDGDKVISISVSSTYDWLPIGVPCLLGCPNRGIIEKAVQHALAQGVIIVAAVNESPDGHADPDFPSFFANDYPNVIAVASSNRDGRLARTASGVVYSSGGSYVTIGAPGGEGPNAHRKNQPDASVLSLWSSASGQPAATCPAGDSTCLYLHGTSQAAPHVAGAVALLVGANPSLTPAEVRTDLQASATAWAEATHGLYGAGILNSEAALRLVLLGQ